MRIESDGSAVLTGRRSKTDQEGQGAYAWLSPDIMRRLAAWPSRPEAAILAMLKNED